MNDREISVISVRKKFNLDVILCSWGKNRVGFKFKGAVEEKFDKNARY